MVASLPQPIGAQRDVAYLKDSGHVVVLGTAGSGKTTMAITRARWLAGHAPDIAGPTLLVTFNRALVNYLKMNIGAREPNLTIENYHAFAKGYLAHRGLMGRYDIAGDRATFLQAAIEEVRQKHPGRQILDRTLRFFDDEIHWLAGNGVQTEDEYINAERIGRGTPLQARDRRLVYEVQQAYLRIRAKAGKRYDWDDLATAVRTEFESDSSPRMYRHVVVDEGQDFSPEMIRSLAAAVGKDGTLTFFGDYAQQMYGSRLSWKSLGLNVQKVVTFEQNYRNSKQIVQLAVALSNQPFFRDEVDLIEPKGAAAEGPLPVLVQLSDKNNQYAQAIRLAKSLGESMTVAVLFRKRDYDHLVARDLPGATKLHRNLSAWPNGPGTFYGTYHAAKGLEFDAVIVPYCDDELLPDVDEVAAHGVDEATAREARLLYVAITRAKTRLFLMHSGKPTHLLPTDPTLYNMVTLP